MQKLNFMKLRNFLKMGLLATMFVMTSCSKDDDSVENPNSSGNATAVYITDAPVDNAQVEAVFVTVSGVKINGKAVEGFSKTTLEISSLTNGQTELLGQLDLEEGVTNDITLVLSETNASGTAPGNYVLLEGGTKEEIAGAMEINVHDSAEILSDLENQVVLDFDLRKSLKAENGHYSLVSEANLENNIRAVNTMNAGTLKGQVENSVETNGEVVVAYAYKKGEFSNSEEDSNNDGIRFSNAASSAVVADSSGNFEIYFLEEGDYELHFASFSDNDADGELEFEGMVAAETAGAIDLNGFSIESESETTITVSFTGLLGL